MPDVVSSETRSRMMAGIRGKHTQPELKLRRSLHKRGYRYRLHVANLPGKPDLVFPKLRAVIQVHGCFWHCHDCHLFRWPSSHIEFWETKITRTRERDAEVNAALAHRGWRVLTVWECSLKGKTRLPPDELASTIERWLLSGSGTLNIQGRTDAQHRRPHRLA